MLSVKCVDPTIIMWHPTAFDLGPRQLEYSVDGSSAGGGASASSVGRGGYEESRAKHVICLRVRPVQVKVKGRVGSEMRHETRANAVLTVL